MSNSLCLVSAQMSAHQIHQFSTLSCETWWKLVCSVKNVNFPGRREGTRMVLQACCVMDLIFWPVIRRVEDFDIEPILSFVYDKFHSTSYAYPLHFTLHGANRPCTRLMHIHRINSHNCHTVWLKSRLSNSFGGVLLNHAQPWCSDTRHYQWDYVYYLVRLR